MELGSLGFWFTYFLHIQGVLGCKKPRLGSCGSLTCSACSITLMGSECASLWFFKRLILLELP